MCIRDRDSTQKELQEEQETLLEEIAALKIPLTEVQEDLKKMCIRDRWMNWPCWTAESAFYSCAV